MAAQQASNYALLLMGWTTLFLAQRSVPSTASHLQTSASFSLHDLGTLLSCFGLAYALMKLACGFLYDSLRLNPKTLFCLGLGAGGLLFLLFPTAARTSVGLTCALWSLVGLFQGLGWPACAHMAKQWYRPSELGKRYSVLSAASNAAAAVSPILCTYIASVSGWETVYYLLGTASLFFTAVLVLGIEYQDNQNNKDGSFENGDLGSHRNKERVYSWHSVFLFREFWLVMALSVTVWTVKASVLDWLQLHLTQQMNFSHSTAAQCVSVSEVGAVVGKLSFAVLSDHLLSKQLFVRKGLCPRAPLLLVLAILLALSTHLYSTHITSDSTQVWVMLVLFVFGFSASGAVGMCSLSLMESVPVALSATSLGVGDCITHLVGRSLVGYKLFSFVVNHPEWGWSSGYSMVAALALTSAATALLLVLSPTTPLHKNKQQ